MRKIVAFMLVALMLSVSAEIMQKAKKVGLQPKKFDAASFTDDVASINENIDMSANGYGWSTDLISKIAMEPQTEMVVETYRQLHPSGSGALAASYGTWTGDTFNYTTSTIFPQPAAPSAGTRYPNVMAKYGYVWVFLTEAFGGADDATSGYLIYDIANDTWTEKADIAGPNATPGASWIGVGDVVYDPNDGVYRIVTTWEDVLNSSNYYMVTGETTDPMDLDSYLWSDYTDTYWEINVNYVDLGGNPKIALNDNGTGLMLTFLDADGTGGDTLGYAITQDYGKTWTWNPVNNFVYTMDISQIYPFVGETYDGTAVNVFQQYVNIDLVTDAEGNFYFANWVKVTNEESIMVPVTDEGSPGDGYWMYKVNVVDSETITVEPHFMGHAIGWMDEQGLLEETFEGKYTNGLAVALGLAGDTIYAMWQDRPEDETQCVLLADLGLAESSSHYVDDLYVASASLSNLDNWNVRDMGDGVLYPHNVTNTPSIHDDGGDVSTLGKYDDANNSLEFYLAYQNFDPDNPLTNPTSEVDHQHFIYSGKVTMDPAGISMEELNLVDNFALLQNYPNPFNPETTISFALKNDANVKLSVYNVAGELVSNLVNETMNSGIHKVNFSGANFNSGVYFYKLDVNGAVQTKKMVLTK